MIQSSGVAAFLFTTPVFRSLIERNGERNMLDPMAETDEGIYLKKSGIDTSVGWLIAGVVVLLFFLLTVLGMGSIQHLSDDVGASSTNKYAPEEKSAEIGDTQSVVPKE
jgi:hypothetical protein